MRATRMMSPRRLPRYASIAPAVESARCRMFVTPSSVSSSRVVVTDTALTSPIGRTLTTSRAARTFIQKRGAGTIRSPLPQFPTRGHSHATERARTVRGRGEVVLVPEPDPGERGLCPIEATGHSRPEQPKGRRPRGLTDGERGAPPCVADERAEQLLRGLELLAIGIGKAGARRIRAPPHLEAPDPLGCSDAQPRDAVARSPRLAGLEVEEAFERRGAPAAVRLAFTAIHEHDARRARAQLVERALRPPARRACERTLRDRTRRGRRHRLRLRAYRPRATAAAPARAPARRLVLHRRSVPHRARPAHLRGYHGPVVHEIFDEFKQQLPDIDPGETQEWIESLDALVKAAGPDRARFVLYKLLKRARMLHVGIPPLTQTRYINTISPEQEPYFPGDEQMELRIRRLIRWNAVAMVLRANHNYPGIGGHLATYASAASLYEVGFNHFFRGKDDGNAGDQIFVQGHASPGIYARAFLEGRLTESQLDHFRREVNPGEGLSSYPHPRLMPEFWEFPTVSMGLGPLAAIYQARFNRYLQHRGLRDTSTSRVWAFLGDGETDEPESLGALHVAAREGLDNLTFVVNCNLQRLDGPVRGNGKIIQELEAVFRGSGWNVIKVIWAREWDELLARDVDGVLVQQMNDTLDGEFQKFSVAGGAYIREHFFGPDQRLRKLVEHLTDDDLARLRRGGHDYRKVYAAYKAATEFKGAPTVILAKTVKGWTLGAGVEARNITHQAKKLSEKELQIFRDRLQLPIPDEKLKEAPYYHPGPKSEEVEYLRERRAALGGSIPKRVVRSEPLPAPAPEVDQEFAAGSQTAVSTTMVFTRILRNLIRDKQLGPRIVPI